VDLRDKTILILGSGLVGRAVARQLLALRPSKIVLVALSENEVREAAAYLDPERGDTVVETAWGNVFMPAAIARCSRGEVLADQELRASVIDDLFGDLSDEVLERNFLFQLLQRSRPEAVVDCINTATAFAYQDVFHSARDLLEAVRGGDVRRELVERHALTLTMPQLIRHVQIVVEGLRRAGTEAYVKIGTSGTGGMGFNIPYTHSEERPSRMLLTKSAIAGAHSLLLFLISRTPGAPSAIEIKPTAAIAWRRIAYGPIWRGGKAIGRCDCPEPTSVDEAFAPGSVVWQDLGRPLESVFIDVGENGFFAKEEFQTVTSLGQMEFITPEEVAEYVVMELSGRPTGRDVVAALDAATAGPTYRAGILRGPALERLERLEQEHGVRSVAFEMLGPPRLSKMLYEADILSRLRSSVRDLAESDPAELSGEAVALVACDNEVRSVIISVGLPILVPGGKVYRGENVIVTPDDGVDLDRIAARGWVDLRPSACETWIDRARRMAVQADQRQAAHAGSGSDAAWNAIEPEDAIVPARFIQWVFRFEDGGERIKR
jgi:hypothetical protein